MIRHFVIGVLFTLYACVNNAVVHKYYDTGELKRIETLICSNDSLVRIEEYYRNGQLKEEGFIVRGRYAHGEWKEYYKDGTVKSHSEYYFGHDWYFKNYDVDSISIALNTIKIEFEDRGEPYFKIGERIRFRIKIEGIHPRLYALYVSDNKNHITHQVETDHNNQYPYLIDIELNLVGKSPGGEEEGVYVLIIFADREGLIDIENSYSTGIQVAIIQ